MFRKGEALISNSSIGEIFQQYHIIMKSSVYIFLNLFSILEAECDNVQASKREEDWKLNLIVLP